MNQSVFLFWCPNCLAVSASFGLSLTCTCKPRMLMKPLRYVPRLGWVVFDGRPATERPGPPPVTGE